MFKKFKILPVVALGICWMVMGNTCFADEGNCQAKFAECRNRGCDAFNNTPNVYTQGYWGCCKGHPNGHPDAHYCPGGTGCQEGINACLSH